MSGTVQGSDGAQLPLDSLAATFTYSGSFISTITVQYPSPSLNNVLSNYVITFTNNGTQITHASGWILT